MRRIDLVCAILAPLAVGFIMTLGSNLAGIIFICAWNIISFFIEYNLLMLVYRAVPRLAVKLSAAEAAKGSVASLNKSDEFSNIVREDDANLLERYEESGYCQKALSRVRNFWIGWHIYFKQPVALAGTSLACLYLTVLGFSSVSTGYIYTQNISGAILSICYGLGSVFGVVGTLLFPRVRKRFGLARTGLISFFMQWSMIALCAISIWTPGSPSDLYPKHIHTWQKSSSTPSKVPAIINTSSNPHDAGIVSQLLPIMTANFTSPLPKRPVEKFSYISISLLLSGLILSRTGLWMTDLTVTQFLQENVAERERGIVSGTQSSFNAVLDMAHYVLAIVMPSPNQFGTLTLISFAAVTFGYFIYILFVCLKSKKLFLQSRDIISVSSADCIRSYSSNDDQERERLTAVDDEEEETFQEPTPSGQNDPDSSV